MTLLFRALAIGCLLLVLVPSIWAYGEPQTPELVKQLMLAGTLGWFVCSYLGFRQNRSPAA